MLMMLAVLSDPDDRDFMMNLYQDYSRLVRSTIYKVTYDTYSTEDLVGDTYIKLIEKVSLLRTLSCRKTATYVVYTARSIAINFIRRRDVHNKHVYYGEDTNLAEKVADLAATVEDNVLARSDVRDVHQAMQSLPEKLRDTLYYKCMLELEDDEIAVILCTTPASVRKYLTRARRAIKRHMQEVEK